jgi:hypothetical protein
MSNCVNGYSKPRFIIRRTNSVLTVDVSLKYQGLKEYWDEKITRHESITGKLKIRFHYLRKRFDLDYSQLLTKADALKIQQVLDALYAGALVRIIPHTDNTAYSYFVGIIAGEKSLGLHYGASKTFGNKDLTISLEVIDPLQSLGWQDPDDKQINLTNLKTL